MSSSPVLGTSGTCKSLPGYDNMMPSYPPRKGLPNGDHMHLLPMGTPSFAQIKERMQICPVVGPYSSGHKMKVVRGSKQFVYDDKEEEYVDCFNSSAHVGHCHPQVVNAGIEQMRKLSIAPGSESDIMHKYVKDLLSTLPEKFNVCFLCNSGSEANDLALRMARAFTGHEDVIVHEETYHGSISSMVDISPKLDFMESATAKSQWTVKDWVHTIPLPNAINGCLVGENFGPCTDPDSEEYKAMMREYLEVSKRRVDAGLTRRGVSGACALFADPSFTIPGLYLSNKEYMKGLYDLARRRHALVISDEVLTGLGRLGEVQWGFQAYDVVPDIVTVGKPLGNGQPLAAVCCSKRVADALGTGYYSTYAGNPVSCAMGLAVLNIIRTEFLLKSSASVGKHLASRFASIQNQYKSMLADVRGRGLSWALEFACYPEVNSGNEKEVNAELAKNVMNGLMRHKFMTAITGKNRNIVLITPPMCFTVENAVNFCNALSRVLEECSNAFALERLSLTDISCRKRSSNSSSGEEMDQGINAGKKIRMADLYDLDD